MFVGRFVGSMRLILIKKIIEKIQLRRKTKVYLRDSSFVIVCPARSGSTMLVHYLRSNPKICAHGEALALGDVRDICSSYGVKICWPVDLKDGVIKELTHLKDQNPELFIYKILFDAAEHNLAGFKIKFDELELRQFEKVKNVIVNDVDIKIIFLLRENLLRRYISLYLAKYVTGITMVTDKSQLQKETTSIVLKPEKCLVDFMKQQELNKKYSQLFSEHRCIYTSYEQLVGNPKLELDSIQEFLGLEPTQLQTITLKTGEKDLNKILVNYDELYSFFKGSEYECFFD